MEIYKEFTCEAAHRLPNVPDGHKCARLHGHSFEVTIFVEAPVDEHARWVMDLADIKTALNPLLHQVDHYCLNEVEGLDNPTSENLAQWFSRRPKSELPELSKTLTSETSTTGSIYRGEDEDR